MDVFFELISDVTDAVHEGVRAWHARALKDIYPIVYLDAVRVNSWEQEERNQGPVHHPRKFWFFSEKLGG